MDKRKEKKVWRAGGMNFDSMEEMYFFFWLQEARSAGMIADWSYQPRTFELTAPAYIYIEKIMKTKSKKEKRSLLQGCSYTPDFLMIGKMELCRVNHKLFSADNTAFWIDVKGTFGRYNDDKYFSIVRKWMWEKYGVYINKVTPQGFFEKTWVPRLAARTKQGKNRTTFLHCPRLWDVSPIPRFPLPTVVSPPEDNQQSFNWGE